MSEGPFSCDAGHLTPLGLWGLRAAVNIEVPDQISLQRGSSKSGTALIVLSTYQVELSMQGLKQSFTVSSLVWLSFARL